MSVKSYNQNVIYPRRITSQDRYSDCLAFFQKLLRAEGQPRLEQEYPLVFRPEFIDQVFIKELGGRIVAGLATLERLIEVQPGRMARALFVGSVVTDPEFRMHGFQRELFHAIEEYAESKEIDFILLWSSQIGFYQKLEFFLGGLQATWTATHQGPIAPIKSMVRVVDSGSVALERKHYESFAKRSHVVQRTFEEMSHLWKIPKMKIAMTDRAYALMGKGEDFEKVCHEWAGPATDVLSCMEALRCLEPNLRILSPGVLHLDEDREVVNRLEQMSYDCRLEYLGLIKSMKPSISEKDFDPAALQFPFFVWGLDSI